MSSHVATRTAVQVVNDIPAIEVVERLIHLMSTVGHPITEARRIVVNEVAEHLIFGGMTIADAEQLAAESVTRIAPWSV